MSRNIKKAIRIKEACEIYSTSSSTIYRLINSGELHANKVGSATYLSVDELNELFLGEVA